MLKKKLRVSYCFGTYNEEQIIQNTIATISKKLTAMFGDNNYEILVVENGSTDNTSKILKQLQNKNSGIL